MSDWTITDSKELADEMMNSFTEIEDSTANRDYITFKHPLEHINRTLTDRMWDNGFRLRSTGTDFVRFVRPED